MEVRNEMVCVIIAVIPILYPGVQTTPLSNLREDVRTSNNSYNSEGDYDANNFRDKYFDVLYQLFKYSRRTDTSEPEQMRRDSRSFDDQFLSSIKREKEELQNLEDLEYYGSEIPKKFTEKRLQAEQYSENNVQDTDGVLLDNLYTDANEHITDKRNENERKSIKNDYSIKTENTFQRNATTFSEFSDNINIQNQQAIHGTSKLSNQSTHPLNTNNVVISKRRFPPRRGGQEETDVCNMDDLEISISFREMMNTDHAGSLLLTCSGLVVVKKCEGACVSQVKPNVNNYDGFERQCKCCKDVSVTTRSVTLSICTLGPEEVHGYSISRTIVEPTACSCQECRN